MIFVYFAILVCVNREAYTLVVCVGVCFRRVKLFFLTYSHTHTHTRTHKLKNSVRIQNHRFLDFSTPV